MVSIEGERNPLSSGRGVPICWGAGRQKQGPAQSWFSWGQGCGGTANGFDQMSDNDKRGGTTEGPNTGVVVKARPKTRKPAMYKVLMLNDDYTPMEFVVHFLERFFKKNREEATRIMLHVHRRGVGVCGVYTYEEADTRVTQVMDIARQT